MLSVDYFVLSLNRASSKNIGFGNSVPDVGPGSGFSAACWIFPSVLAGTSLMVCVRLCECVHLNLCELPYLNASVVDNKLSSISVN